jgi:hypothetical protein
MSMPSRHARDPQARPLRAEKLTANYGPTIAAYRGIADDPDRVAALDRDLADLAERHQRAAGSTAMEWEYLLLTGRKRG